MGKGFLGCLLAALTGAGLAFGQPADKSSPTAPAAAPPTEENLPTPRAVAAPPLAPGEVGKGGPVAGPDGLYPEGFGDFGGPSDRFWFSAEYLLWWFKKPQFPPLVTTGPFSSQGIVGQPGTVILFGGPAVDDNRGRSGVRLTAGAWLDCDKTCGIEASVFYFPERSNDKVFGGETGQLLARPFISLNTMTENAEITSLMGLAKGMTTVSTPSQLFSPEVNFIHKLCCGCCYQLDLLYGFRYLELKEAVDITETIRVNPDPTQFPPGFQGFSRFAGSTIIVNDRFSTKNQFYGGQIGFDYGCCKGPWELQVRGKLGLGDNHEIIDINGGQRVTFADGTVQGFRGGLLALPSNIGHFTRDRFAVLPEVNVNVGYRVTQCLSVYVGYTFLYLSRVVRPGDQIDRVIDTSQIPNFGQGTPTGFGRPAVPFKETDFWAQGLNVGVEITW